MDPSQGKKRIILIIAACIIVAIIVALLVWWPWLRHSANPSASSGSGNNISNGGIASASFSQNDYQAALARAQSWEPDAALLNMTSGGGQLWDFVFVSQSANGQALEVATNGQTVVSTQEVSISGSGAALPQNIIPPSQALTEAHAIPGNTSSSIQSIELVYSAVAKQWYWGMKTAKGFTISVKATQ